MIIDLHTHLCSLEHLSEAYINEASRVNIPREALIADPDRHYEGTKGADRVVVLAFQAPFSGIVVPNDYVASYVKRDPKRLVGFMSVDPNDPSSLEEIERAYYELGLRGLKLGPMYQNFHPGDKEKSYPIYEKAKNLGLPILFHMGTTYTRCSRLAFTRPILLEDVAIDFPELKMVVAHLGHPFEAETIVLIRKQPNVYADVSALFRRPWQLYNSLRLAYEYGVFGKLLFGTDFPFSTVEETVKGLFEVCRLARRARLPEIPEELVFEVVQRDSFALLGI
jgi:hypothetical protein